MKKQFGMLLAMIAFLTFAEEKRNIELGGFGLLSAGGAEYSVLLMRPVLRLHVNDWFFVAPVYTYKMTETSETFGSAVHQTTNQYAGVEAGATLWPVKFIALSLSPSLLAQFHGTSERYGNTVSETDGETLFALGANAHLKCYIRENIALGLMYYLAVDVLNDGANTEGGLMLGFSFFL